VGTGDVVLVLAGQTNSTTTLELFLLISGDILWGHGGAMRLCDDDNNNDDIDSIYIPPHNVTTATFSNSNI